MYRLNNLLDQSGYFSLPVFLILFSLIFLSPMGGLSQSRYDILITECLPDPTPSVGLPESAFIEISNRSMHSINLQNWKISNGNATATVKSETILEPDSILILCSTTASKDYVSFGAVLGLSGFPSLNKESGQIILKSNTDQVIHAISYNKNWFHNNVKASGGWSLEMIDLTNLSPDQNNWAASISEMGGTPGKRNSVNGNMTDENPPSLIRSLATDSITIELLLNEAMDSSSAADISNYQISNGIGQPIDAACLPPLFDRIKLKLANTLQRGQVYQITIEHLKDLNANEIGPMNTCKTGLPDTVKNNDLIFNEILFNPPTGGSDYIEVLNRSSKIINCATLYMTNRGSNGQLKDPERLTTETRNLFPGDYLLLTEDSEWVLRNYPQSASSDIMNVHALPSLPDDLGSIILLNQDGELIDELSYDHHWHSPLLANEEGVSLERIRTNAATNLASNWSSASASSGYGTPGYKNSEFLNDSFYNADAFVSTDTRIFSPDLDGYQDFCFLHYHLPDAGYVGSITVYDVAGNSVCNLVNNLLWGTSGLFRWDGTDDRSQPLPTGRYILYAEVFQPNGSIKRQKIVVALVRNKRKY